MLLLGRAGAEAAGWATSRPGGAALCSPLAVFCPHFWLSQRCAFGVVFCRFVFLTVISQLLCSHGDPGLYLHVLFEMRMPNTAVASENLSSSIAMRRFVFSCDSLCGLWLSRLSVLWSNMTSKVASHHAKLCMCPPPPHME